MLLDIIMKGESINEVIEKHKLEKTQDKKDLKASVMEILNKTDIFELKIYLENVNKL